MTFIFETPNRKSERECSMEDAIESARRRVLDGMVDYIILYVKSPSGKEIRLGSYFPSPERYKYTRQFPDVECVEVREMLHCLPKESYYNAAAWRIPNDLFKQPKTKLNGKTN